MSLFSRLLSFFGANTDTGATESVVGSSTPEITITRIFDVNRQKVWEMWTRADKLSEWFGIPPIAATKDTTKIDLRVGGRWQADMVNEKDGSVMPFRGTYLEINTPQKLVFTIENPQNPSDPNVETVTVTFKDRTGVTEMTLHQSGHLPKEQYGTPLENGYNAFLDRMVKYLLIHTT